MFAFQKAKAKFFGSQTSLNTASKLDFTLLNVNFQTCSISNKALIYREAKTQAVIAGGSKEKAAYDCSSGVWKIK